MNSFTATSLRSASLRSAARWAAALSLCGACMAPSWAQAAPSAEPLRSIEALLTAAQQDKKGVTVHVNGQQIGGAVVRLEPGQWVELRNQQFGRIVLRLDRVDAVAMP